MATLDASDLLAGLTTRLMGGAVATALLSAGGVYFVVDQSLRGVETAVAATNERLGDNADRLGRIETRLDSMDARLRAIEGALAVSARDSDERDADLLRLSASARETLQLIEGLRGSPDLSTTFDAQLLGQIGGLQRMLEDMEAAIARRRDREG